MALAQARDIITSDKSATFRHIRDFLASQNGIADYSASGAGYTIVDSSYASTADTPAANDWCVLKSHGEAEGWPLYHKLTHGSSSSHSIKSYLAWNPATHTGWGELYQSDNIQCGTAGCTLHIHADLDEIHILIQPGSSSYIYWSPFFRLGPGQTLYSGQALQLADALPARSVPTIIPLPSWPDWAQAGKKICNWDGKKMQALAITAVNEPALTITVASTQAMAAGSWLVEDMCYGVPYNATGNAKSTSSLSCQPSRLGGMAKLAANRMFLGLGVLGPEDKYGERLIAPVWVGNNGKLWGRLKLVYETSAVATQGEAWRDPKTGQAYRIYTVYSGVPIAVREA